VKRLKVGFHYPSSRPEFTGRIDGPRTRVHFLTPVNSGSGNRTPVYTGRVHGRHGARLWCLPCHAKRVCWCASVTDIHSSLDDACRPCVVDRTVRWPQTRWDESGCCLLEKSSYSLYTVYRVPGVRRNVLLEDEEVNSPDTSRITGNRCSDRSTSR